MIDEAVKLAGQLDILANVAGTIRRAPFLEHSEEDFDFVMKINLYAPVFLSQGILPPCRWPPGQGQDHQYLLDAVVSGRHSGAGLHRLEARHCRHHQAGRQRNGLVRHQLQRHRLGYIATANTAPIRADAERNKAIVDRIPAGRWGQPEDLADTAVFLASPASDYINGAIINVDGGWQAR